MDITWQGFVDIAAPVDKVYAYLADFPKHCEWAQTLESMELKKPGDANGVGAVYRTGEALESGVKRIAPTDRRAAQCRRKQQKARRSAR